MAERLSDLSAELASVGSRDTAFPLPHGRGDEFRQGSPGPESRERPTRPKPRDIYVPDRHIDAIRVTPRNFR